MTITMRSNEKDVPAVPLDIELRDYFAAQALIAMADRGETPESIADDCYELADAMLKARGEQP